MQRTLELEMEKNEFFVCENINFSIKNIQTTKEEIKKCSTEVTAEIHYIVTAVYRYNPESRFGKNYNAIEECKQHYVQIKDFDEEKQKWTYIAPETIVPTYLYKYPESGAILNIQIKCFFQVNFKFGEEKGSFRQEITIVEQQQSPPHKRIKKDEIITILCTKSFIFYTFSRYTVKWGLDFNFNEINLTFHGDPERRSNVRVSYQLCFEFKVSDKTFFTPQVTACPRIILQKGDILLNNNSKGEVEITLPQGKEICPLTNINFRNFSCSHYLILKIEFLTQECFQENPCEIKIPIEISKRQQEIRENCQETPYQNTMEIISDKQRNNNQQCEQQELIKLQKEYYFKECSGQFECYQSQSDQIYEI